MMDQEASTPELYPARRFVWLSVYFVSGACSLTYQIIWARLFAQVIGSTIQAVSLVTALFMAGLALGSAIGGRLADRMQRPLRGYVIVEGATVLLAMVSFIAVPATKELFAHAAARSAALRGALTVGLPLLLVAPATTLMGAGMPMLARALSVRASHVGHDAGIVYVANTAGALIGAALTGFILIRRLGVTTTWVTAVAANALIALVALALSRLPTTPRRERPAVASTGSPESAVTPLSMNRGLLITLFVFSGFLSFGYELYWTRSLITILGNSTYAITSVLIVTLLGLVIGGAAMSRRVDRIRRPLRVLGILEAGIGVASLIALPVLIGSLYTEGVQAFFFAERGGWIGSTALRLGVASAALLIPSILNGATLPLMLKTMTQGMATRGHDIGLAYAADAGGNVLGVLVPAFILLPLAGVSRGLLALGLANLVLGLVYMLPRRRRWPALPLAATMLVLVAAVPINFQFPSDTYTRNDPVVFYEEGIEATTRVYRKQDTGDYHMSVDGVFIGGSGDAARKEIVLAHLPVSIRPEGRSVLTVGLGSGVLAAELASHAHLEEIVVVEIAPSVARGAVAVPAWASVHPADPRIELQVDDVMNYLLVNDERYDIIVSDGKSRPTARGNGLFFSTDYYEALRERLAENGVVFQWVSLHLAGADFQTILRTFASSFDYVALWWLPDTDAFLIGSDAPFSIPDSDDAPPPAGLRDYGITDAATTTDLVVAVDDELRRIAGPGEVSTLDHPHIEFFDIRAYAAPASAMIAENLSLLARATNGTGSHEEDLKRLILLLAAAYSGEAEPQRVDAYAAEITGSSDPIAAAVSRYFAARASGRLRAGAPATALDYARKSSASLPALLAEDRASADALYLSGLAHLALGNRAEASIALGAAVTRRPASPRLRVALARSLVAQGRTAEAVEQYEAVLALMPENVSALQSVGVANAAQGEIASALELLERAYARAPDEPSVIDSYAWVLHLAGRNADARVVLRRGGEYAEGRPDFEERRRLILAEGDER